MITRPLLRYHGGKFRMAPWLISKFPKHKCYVEPFCGAASVLLRKERCYQDVINDLNGDVVNLFTVLRDEVLSKQLISALELTPFSRDEFEQSYEISDCPVERARRLIARSFMGFGSAACNPNFKTGFRSNSSRSGTTPAIDWRNYPHNLPFIIDRLRGVIVENKSAEDVIRQHDSAETLIYCDPPYVHETRDIRRNNHAYVYEMTDEEHIQLSETLKASKSMIVLSGYRCPLYDDLYIGWERQDFATHADGASDRVESVWLNPYCSRMQDQRHLFDQEAMR